MMTTASPTKAVFFLGTRAHYQVLQQPTSQSDLDNGNVALDNYNYRSSDVDETDATLELGSGVKRRRGCDDDNQAYQYQLNDNDETPKKGFRGRSVLSLLTALARRTRAGPVQPGPLGGCTYRESCRCLECQSSYFDCDESEDSLSEVDYDNFEYNYHTSYAAAAPADGSDDEVFTAPNDNTSADLLLESQDPSWGQSQPQAPVKMSTSSDDVDGEELQIEVAAGTPVFLNYLLTHPVTCCIQ